MTSKGGELSVILIITKIAINCNGFVVMFLILSWSSPCCPFYHGSGFLSCYLLGLLCLLLACCCHLAGLFSLLVLLVCFPLSLVLRLACCCVTGFAICAGTLLACFLGRCCRGLFDVVCWLLVLLVHCLLALWLAIISLVLLVLLFRSIIGLIREFVHIAAGVFFVLRASVPFFLYMFVYFDLLLYSLFYFDL
jgi:hypothetical protein